LKWLGARGLSARARLGVEMEGMISQFAGEYREWAPGAALREHVRCVWMNDLTRSRAESIQVVPDGCADILWTGDALCVAGPDTRPIVERLRAGVCVVGIRFHPGAASAWLGVPLNEIVNGRIPLAEFWGDDAERLSDAICEANGVANAAMEIAADLEAALAARLGDVGGADHRIAFLRAAAGGRCDAAPVRMRQLAARMGLSERTLRRRCMDAFGYGFKTLDRVLRFQRFFRLAARLQDRSLAELALQAGYADQAHLTREVQRMSGTTAGQFVAQLAPFQSTERPLAS
jgi:AraC-like DNA-binding protein